MPIVALPDGRQVNFPDGTASDVMEKAMRDFAATPAPRAAPVGPLRAMAHGAMDPVQGGAQALIHALPSGAVDAVNNAASWANRQPVLGPVTRALGMVPSTVAEVDDQTKQREAAYQADRSAAGQTGTDWGRMAGSVAPALAASLAMRNPSSLMGAIGQGVGTGAAMGAAQPVTDAENYGREKRNQVLLNAATGAAGGAAGQLLGRAIAPVIAPEARALRNAGVELTPGQALGGVARRIEDASTSLPLVGDVISAAKNRSIESMNRATANAILRPLNIPQHTVAQPSGTTIGQTATGAPLNRTLGNPALLLEDATHTIPLNGMPRAADDVIKGPAIAHLGRPLDRNAPVGRALVREVSDRIRQAYDASTAAVRPFGPDPKFAQDLAGASQRFLTPSNRDAFAKALQEHVVSRLQQGPIDGATYQTVKSELGHLAARYNGSTTAADRELGEAFTAVQRSMQDLMARQNPQVAPALQAADHAYAGLVRLQDAAGRVGATDGVFTAAQLSSAVRAGDNTVRHNGYARGDAMLQDLSDAARNVLPSSVADSGTARRLMNAAAVGGAMSGAVPAPLLAGAAGAAALYAPPVSRAVVGLLARQPGQGASLLGSALARTGRASGAPLASLLSPPR